MIKLNNYDNLRAYVKKPQTGEEMLIFEFKENDKPCDVVFNFNAVLKGYRIAREFKLDDEDFNPLVKVIAKNITFNYDCECDFIECENLVAKKMLACKHCISVKKNVVCRVIYCNFLKCENLDAYKVQVKYIDGKKIKARGLIIDDKSFCYIYADSITNEKEMNV